MFLHVLTGHPVVCFILASLENGSSGPMFVEEGGLLIGDLMLDGLAV